MTPLQFAQSLDSSVTLLSVEDQRRIGQFMTDDDIIIFLLWLRSKGYRLLEVSNRDVYFKGRNQ